MKRLLDKKLAKEILQGLVIKGALTFFSFMFMLGASSACATLAKK